ncbi:MAG: histidine phosphatase family protein [Anaerolineae bacterium]|nr:histidine phosphatase family protein [Anaerolineae bacterium]
MKTVFLLRHAKSKQDLAYATDFERPLAKRGKQDAERLGAWMATEDLVPDLVISSPAKRAKQTTQRCTEAADYQGEIRFDETLYCNGEDAYLVTLERLDDTVQSVMLVGHNPDISIAVEMLSGQSNRMPTAALARIDLAIVRWSALMEKGVPGKLAWVQLPHELDTPT